MSGTEEDPGAASSVRHGLPELIAERREKARRLREADDQAFPYHFRGTEPIAEILSQYEHLSAGDETEDKHRVAGRLLARREGGGAAFLDLLDRTGKIQLHARMDVLGEQRFAELTSLDIGDLIGVDGAMLRSRRGEISLRVDSFALLAKALRPPPDKRGGLADVETRHRRRELDLIANEDARRVFLERAQIVRAVRAYLDSEGFIEVETPVLQPLYGGALARPFTTHHNVLERTLYLRIATELYLKRLLVGGLERVYELGKDFRNEGLSPKHNPEFTMLEWYEAYADYLGVAERFERLMEHVAQAVGYAGPHDLSPPWRCESVQDAIRQRTGVDVLAHRDRDSLAAEMRAHELEVPPDRTWAQLVHGELISKHVEPRLQEPTLLLDYPVELSPFAKRHRSRDGLVERFEAFCGGIELANSFTELNDPDEQRARFEAQRAAAAAGDEEAQPFDEDFLAALEQAMAPTRRIGLGSR